MSPTNTSSRGFSLIELMVGLTLGMIGMMIVAKVLEVSSGHQSNIAAAGEAQSIGNLSLYTIERELKQAGFGIASPTLLGCQLKGYYVPTSFPIAKTLYPVDITAPTNVNDSDTLGIAYGTSEMRMGPVTLATAYAGDAADIDVQNRFGLNKADYFILGQITSPATPCILGQISAIPTSSTTGVSHTGTFYPFNKVGGLGTGFSANIGEFYDLGGAFNLTTYSVDTGKHLVQTSALTGIPSVIADNVLVFKARYGHDSNGDGTVDVWDTTIPTTSAGWASTTNVRMGLAVKNPRREGGLVTATPLVIWPGGPSVALSAEEQHYRYRTYNVIVPLRNMIWRTF